MKSIKQKPISLQIPIREGQVAALTALLETGQNPQLDSQFFQFSKLKDVHFARLLIAPEATLANGKICPASLIYAANVDGGVQEHYAELLKALSEDLDQVLDHCQGYPTAGDRTPASRLAYLKKHQLKTPGFYAGAPNRSVAQIHQEADLQKALQVFVKENGSKWSSSDEAYVEIERFLKGSEWDWARKKYRLPRVQWLKMALLGLFLLIILVPLLIYALVIQIFSESRAKPFGVNINQVPDEHMVKMMDKEDIVSQNQLSQVFETKRGLRKLGLHFFLWQTSMLAKWLYVGGQLLGTPTIHFARWVIIDGGKRFVFFSNFDGSYDQYLGDFVDNSGWGLNLIYGASVGYPKTLMLALKGAYQIGDFMGWGRLTQVDTQIWYSAYPWQGLPQIVDRSKLRAALFNSGTLNEKQIQEMLRRI